VSDARPSTLHTALFCVCVSSFAAAVAVAVQSLYTLPVVLMFSISAVSVLLAMLWRRYARMSALLSDVETANLAKTSFLSFICHELRNPLHAIAGMNELMGEMPLSSKQREFVDSIASCSNIMCTIVNDGNPHDDERMRCCSCTAADCGAPDADADAAVL
jgi:signal transduction histidine kinase